MAKKLVTDELWEVIESLLPQEPPKPNGGRPRIDAPPRFVQEVRSWSRRH